MLTISLELVHVARRRVLAQHGADDACMLPRGDNATRQARVQDGNDVGQLAVVEPFSLEALRTPALGGTMPSLAARCIAVA
ncbi:MAG TPA: hypothetical protein VK669_01920 [Candidatus Limnocylindrales bacterium]|nr:hypothetical protein [Candidatus Limnocylindrales bacterium]